MLTAVAHGLSERADLPLPRWLFGWAAAVVLIVSFVALAVLWPRPKLQQLPTRRLPGGRLLTSRAVEIVCGALGVAAFVGLLHAEFSGSQEPSANITPVVVFVLFWVGLVAVSVVVGDVYAAFDPWRAIGRVAFRRARRPYPARLGRYPAAAGLVAFTALEVIVPDGSVPERTAAAAIVYSVATFAGMAVYGVEAWRANGDAFAAYFGLFARMAPFAREGREIVVRPPLAGLPGLPEVAGTPTLLAVMIGTVTYDGLSQAAFYREPAASLRDAVGVTAAGAIGMTACIAAVLALYLLGTASRTIDFTLIGAETVWYLQAGLVVVGHVLALALAHDRALVLKPTHEKAVLSQFWMLVVMVGYTTLALLLLSQANA